MKHFYGLSEGILNEPCNIAFGSFDGIHTGHITAIKKLVSLGSPSVIISFQEDTNPVLTTENEKEYYLRQAGVDILVSVPSGTFSEKNIPEFIASVESAFPGVMNFVVSESFAENHPLLNRTITVPDYLYKGNKLTSASLKNLLETESFDIFLEALGHPYSLCGTIEHGKGNGAKHNMPTANLLTAPNKILPPYGVYGSISCTEEGCFQSATNIGTRPSVDNSDKVTIESFLPEYHGDGLYDKPYTLLLYCFVREIRKFSSLDEVKKQVDKDFQYIKDFFLKL